MRQSLAAPASGNTQTFRTDTGPELDFYQPCDGGDNEIDFNIHVNDLDVSSIESATLTLAVWDVDFNCNGSCCERDSVYVNGHRLTTPVKFLTGANQQWSTVTFNVNPEWIVDGDNYIQIFIDLFCSPKPYWCVTCDWGELTIKTEEIDVKVDEIEILDDISIRDGSGNAITDPVWSGNNPSTHKAIADASKDGSLALDGSLKVKTHLEATPSMPSWEPKCKYGWWILGAGKSDSGQFTGWDGAFTVPMPEKVGKYELTLMYKIYDDEDNEINVQSMTHDLYVTHDKPIISAPKTSWLDKGCAWASGATSPVEVVTNINKNIYNNSGWIYTYPVNNWEQLVEGSGRNGDCNRFAAVWSNLSKCLGVSTSLYPFHMGSKGKGLVTTAPATALDTKPGNAYPAGGSLSSADRWVFSGHRVGQHSGSPSVKYYDPTTGNIYNTPNEYVEWDLEAMVPGQYYQVGRKGGEYVTIYQRAANNPVMTPWIWGAFEYFGPFRSARTSVSPMVSPPRSLAQAASGGAHFTGAHAEHGIDSDGNGRHNYFEVKADVEIKALGDYSIYGTLFFNGEEITSQPEANSPLPTYCHLPEEPGRHQATLRFSGEAIHESGKSGIFSVELRLVDNSGTLIDTLSFDTSDHLSTDFGETPALITGCSDRGLDTNGDGLCEYLSAKVSTEAYLSGEYIVEVILHATDGNIIGTASKKVPLSGSGEVEVLLDGGEIRMSEEDGPYSLRVVLSDAGHSQIGTGTFQTSFYNHNDFQRSGAAFAGNFRDYGMDTDGDGSFDHLTIEAEVNVVEDGTYTAMATLADSTGEEIAGAEKEANLQKGTRQVALQFDGVKINRHGKNGPYLLKTIILQNESSKVIDAKSDAYATSSYQSTDFKTPPSFFRYVFSDYGEDTNGDGYFESLVVEVGVDVLHSGNYLLRGALYDQNGKQITLADAELHLDAGPRSMKLRFDGFSIFNHAADGPYRLGYVMLSADNSSLLDSQADAYTTSGYSYKNFHHFKVSLTGKYSDYGSDTDNDGKYDHLAVDVEVFVENGGRYALNARILDKSEHEIVWASTTSWLPAGENSLMRLNFNGKSIYDHGVDGPYYVKDVYIYNMSDTSQSDSVYDAHATAPYNYWKFGNLLPQANAGGPYSGDVGSPITFDGSASYDPDGTIVSYEWDFNNDGIYDATTASPTVTHTYAAAYSGMVTLRVTDNRGLQQTATASVEITAPHVPGDLDGDGDVDRDDVNIIKAHLNQPADSCRECPAYDIDGDGTITGLDARKLVKMCTCARCLCP